MIVKFYEGERIYFRPIELDDEPRLRAWINNPLNWSTLARCMPVNGVREREWIDGLYKDDRNVVLAVVAREGDRHIGNVGLHAIDAVNRKAKFGIMIGDTRFQGLGYGSEAVALTVKYGFEVLNLHRIELDVFADNARARRAYEKAGFVAEGVARQAYYRHGEWVDDVRYAVLRDEWQRKSRDRQSGIELPVEDYDFAIA